MDCKPSIVFFIILLGTSIEYAIKLAYNQWAYICALRYLFRALPQVSYDLMICIDSSSIHELSFKKLNGVKVVVPNAFMYRHICTGL